LEETNVVLYAHVVMHNAGSIRVLEKCGLRREREEEARVSDDSVVELTYVLDD
jgi:RimJ/RimL family protein N-acetyltransferase